MRSGRIARLELTEWERSVFRHRRIDFVAPGGDATLEIDEFSEAGFLEQLQGAGGAAAGATVHVGSRTVVAGGDGVARVDVSPGGYSVYASQAGRIRSFSVRAEVK